MSKQEQILKRYILSEIYSIEKTNYKLFLERKDLLEEGKVWDLAKSSFKKIKSVFKLDPTTKKGYEELKKRALKKGNHKLASDLQDMVDALENKKALNNVILAGVMIVATAFNSIPGPVNNVVYEKVSEEISQTIPQPTNQIKNYNYKTPERQANDYRVVDTKQLSRVLRKYIDTDFISVDEIEGELNREETSLYRKTMRDTNSSEKAKKAVIDFRNYKQELQKERDKTKEKELKIKAVHDSMFGDKSYDEYYSPYLSEDGLDAIINYSSKEENIKGEEAKYLNPVLNDINNEIKKLENELSTDSENKDIQSAIDELKKLNQDVTSLTAFGEIYAEENAEENHDILEDMYNLEEVQNNEDLKELFDGVFNQ